MNKLIATTMACVFTATFAGAGETAKAPDAAQAEIMKKYIAANTPGEAHKKLAEYAGEWKYTSKMWENEKAKPRESKGEVTMTSVMGGRFLQQNFKGEAFGQPFEGIGFVGFNNVIGKYESIWLDSMGTGIMKTEGSMDKSKKTITETGKVSCPIDGLKDVKGEWTLKDKNNMSYTMYSTFPGGTKIAKQMEIIYKRAK